MTRLLIVCGFLVFQSVQSAALECAKNAKLKQSEGKENTLHTWCEAEGRRDGPYEVFSVVNGGLQLQAGFKNGKLDGPFKRFDALGNPQTVGSYANGEMNGTWTRYWSKDKLRDQGEWKNGKPVGEWLFVDEGSSTERRVSFGSRGKVERPKDLDDRWRYMAGFIHTERYGFYKPGRSGDDAYTVDLIGLDVERRLVNWKRYIRLDATARLLPEKLAESEDVVVSAQLGLSIDFLRNLTGPVALYTRFGAHFTDLDDDRFLFGLGIRYHLKRYKPGTYFSGFFVELGHVDYESDNDYQNNPGYQGSDGDSGLDTFFTGVFWSAF